SRPEHPRSLIDLDWPSWLPFGMQQRASTSQPNERERAVDAYLDKLSIEPVRNTRSEEHTSELQSHLNLVCRLLLEKKKKNHKQLTTYNDKHNRIIRHIQHGRTFKHS